jgi:hypothetical protein
MVSKEFLDRSQKVQIIEYFEFDKLDSMKTKVFYSSKDTIKKMNRGLAKWLKQERACLQA